MQLIGDIFFLSGTIFLFLGALGLIRMPDVYNRIQAGTKAVTLGSILTLMGIFFYFPQWWGHLCLIILFLLFTNPVSSSALARAFYRNGISVWTKTK